MKEYMAVKPNNNRADRGKNRKAGNSPKVSALEEREDKAKELHISSKTKAFYDELIDNPKVGVREAYKKHVGDSTSELQASVNASRLKNSDNYEIYKASAVGKAKKRIVQLVSSDNESIALKASQDIIDRTSGKAVQKSDITQRIVEVKLDLSGVRIGAHYIPPAPAPQLLEE